MKDVLDVNTSNTSSNTSDVLKTGRMYWNVFNHPVKDVSDVLLSWQDVLYDVLVCIESPNETSQDVLTEVTVTVLSDVLDVLN